LGFLADAGCLAVAVDLRGFGNSEMERYCDSSD
jgi:hypothetical protein